jgi:hypothetical protein
MARKRLGGECGRLNILIDTWISYDVACHVEASLKVLLNELIVDRVSNGVVYTVLVIALDW